MARQREAMLFTTSMCKMVWKATAGSSLSLSHDETPDSSSGGFAGGALHAGGLPVQGRGTLASRGKAGSVMKQLIWAEIVPPLDGGGIERRTVGDRCVRFYRPPPPPDSTVESLERPRTDSEPPSCFQLNPNSEEENPPSTEAPASQTGWARLR